MSLDLSTVLLPVVLPGLRREFFSNCVILYTILCKNCEILCKIVHLFKLCNSQRGHNDPHSTHKESIDDVS